MGIYLNPGNEDFKRSINSNIYVDKTAMVVELKYDKTADSALDQIKRKKYTKVFKSYRGEILLVGINYNKETKKHECVIEKVKK